MQSYRYIFLKEVQEEIEENDLSKEESNVRKYQRASAWYMVVYSGETKNPLSFPWILSDVLTKIKRHRNGQMPLKSNFLQDIDSDIEVCFSGALKYDQLDSQEACKCIYLSVSILYEWISNSRLNFSSNGMKSTCNSCFKRIVDYFRSKSGLYCCSASSRELCNCSEMCSPAKFILEFLKYFVKKTSSTIGECAENCDGFVPQNLQELALQTLSFLAITRDINYLGLDFNSKNFTSRTLAEETSNVLFEEGEPLRIPVKTEVLKNIIEYNREDVMEYLKKKSGVQHIVLQPESDLHDNLCIIVNSSGKIWQRWNLEVILLDPDFTEKIENALKENCPVE
ncbi:RNA-dependent RNA polymerase [Caerostris extrusa]|uniref:RNA-dependent RNA polymerase n=1 Tax=Caerostris extrusa TaxID=172846 RepID=A0AAV4VDF7_CAEEX|nr:RNA-dependent RNA polymerase [Caerostris extrusa]